MKKLLLGLVFVLGVTLTGCIPEDVDDNPITTTYTEEELIDLIEELIPEATVHTTYDIMSFEDAVVDMVDQAKTGVLGVINSTLTSQSTGSGVIYKKVENTYYLVTNNHVVEGNGALTIVYEKNGLLFVISNNDVTLVGTDATTDLAVLSFESDEDFAVIPFADSYDISLGEFVFAIGNPLGFDYYGTVTMGIVSGLARYERDEESGFNATLLQHDAAISPGNSGGALLNINGELIGINNMKIVNDDVSNIGFAIPSNTVYRIASELEEFGFVTRPYLGVVTYASTNTCGLDYGVCLIEVKTDGAADNAKLEINDIIIGYQNDGMDEFLVINNFNDLKEAILNSSVGETIRIKYIRNGIEYISPDTILGVEFEDLGE